MRKEKYVRQVMECGVLVFFLNVDMEQEQCTATCVCALADNLTLCAEFYLYQKFFNLSQTLNLYKN
jgi:hypothetical protein